MASKNKGAGSNLKVSRHDSTGRRPPWKLARNSKNSDPARELRPPINISLMKKKKNLTPTTDLNYTTKRNNQLEGMQKINNSSNCKIVTMI